MQWRKTKRITETTIPRSTTSAEQEQQDQWVEQSRSGDVAAFNRLVLRWERAIYNLSLRMTRNVEEAADITQDVFLAAFQGIEGFRGQSQFSTWLYRIAVNRCLSHLAHRTAFTWSSLDQDDFPIPGEEKNLHTASHEEEIIRRQDGQRAVKAMQGLPWEWKIAIELRFFQELTFDQMAEVLHMPVSSVKSRLYAGLQALQERLR